MARLLESYMIDSAKARFRAFNITLPTAGTTAPPNLGQFLLQGQTSGSTLTQKTFASTSTLSVMTTTTPTISPTISPTLSIAPSLTIATATPQTVPPALFRAASSSAVDVNCQTQATNEYSNYIAGICHAIAAAHDDWRLKAFLRGVQINAVMAKGGNISGPSLSPMIASLGPQAGLWGSAVAFTRAIADGLAGTWDTWAQSVTVPGLPWYPVFAAYPAPAAPPIPNVPCPMTALTWNPTMLMPDVIKSAISQRLSTAGPYANELFTSIATGFVDVVNMWLPQQTVMNVLGRGPVPSWAPPYVPVAPVVGGSIIEAPVHFP